VEYPLKGKVTALGEKIREEQLNPPDKHKAVDRATLPTTVRTPGRGLWGLGHQKMLGYRMMELKGRGYGREVENVIKGSIMPADVPDGRKGGKIQNNSDAHGKEVGGMVKTRVHLIWARMGVSVITDL